MSNAREPKATLRKTVRARVAAISPAARATASGELSQRLLRSEFWASAKTALLYAPMPDEPDIWPLVEAALVEGKIVALPRFLDAQSHYAAACVRDLKSDLQAGKFGIREPVKSCTPMPFADVNLVLVPAIAFDLRGRRLGRGKGYYDRLLTEISGTKCGVAFDEQMVEEIPFETHDQQMDWIATPTRLIRIRREN